MCRPQTPIASGRRFVFIHNKKLQTPDNMIQDLIIWGLAGLASYWVIIALMAVESSFIPFPSEVVVPPAAWYALQHPTETNFFLVILAATLGANIGALINYYLAAWLGRPVVYKFADSRLGRLCLLSGEKLEYAEAYFRKHGATSTFVGRLVPAVRQLISIPAGLSRMSMPTFLLYTTLGAGSWNVVLALIGYAIYRLFPNIRTPQDVVAQATEYSHYIGYAILVIVACGVLWLLYKNRHRFMGKSKG